MAILSRGAFADIGRARYALLREAMGLASLVLLGFAGVAAAEEELPPDAELLEYLGSWQGPDEDWLLFERAAADAQANDDGERSDPEPEGEELPESEDEH